MNKSLSLTIFSILFFTFCGFAGAQTYDTVWTANFWTGYSDSVGSMQETSDGNFIMTGNTLAQGEFDFDVLLVKADSAGGEGWIKKFGGDDNETGFHVLETMDGGYLISANSDAFGTTLGDYKIWIIKTDSAGDTTWTFPLTQVTHAGWPLHAVQTYDSGYAITGIYNYSYDFKAFILRLDSRGEYRWCHSFDADGLQDGRFIAELPNRDFIVAGNMDNGFATGYDYWLFRTDSLGVKKWDSTYILTDYHDEMHAACLVDDGIVMTGLAQGKGHVHKTDFDGNTIWSKSVSIKQADEKIYSICTTADGGLMLGGWLGVVGQRRDYNFLKLDAVGDTIWTFTVGGDDDDHGRSVAATDDGGFVMAGNSDSFVNGNSIYMVKINEISVDVGDNRNETVPTEYMLIDNYPNPFNAGTMISYSIPYRSEVSLIVYDLLGRKVKTLVSGVRSAGNYQIEWLGDNGAGRILPTGIYFYQLKSIDFSQTRKMVMIK